MLNRRCLFYYYIYFLFQKNRIRVADDPFKLKKWLSGYVDRGKKREPENLLLGGMGVQSDVLIGFDALLLLPTYVAPFVIIARACYRMLTDLKDIIQRHDQNVSTSMCNILYAKIIDAQYITFFLSLENV